MIGFFLLNTVRNYQNSEILISTHSSGISESYLRVRITIFFTSQTGPRFRLEGGNTA